MIELKNGVDLSNLLAPPMLEAVAALDRVFRLVGARCVITSGRDGVHMEGSKHYTGEALDFRLRHVSAEVGRAIVVILQEALGAEFDVIFEEKNGVRWGHLEFDPPDLAPGGGDSV